MTSDIRPSSDLRNLHANTAHCNQMVVELELLRELAVSEHDAEEGRIASMFDTLTDIRTELAAADVAVPAGAAR